MSKESKLCCWSVIRLINKGGLGLKGINKYDLAFLEEFELNKLGNTDAAINALRQACTSFKFPYRVILQDKDLTEIKVIYEPKE